MKPTNMKPTSKKPLRKAAPTDLNLKKVTAELEGLKRENVELRALVRCLASATQIAQTFLQPQLVTSSAENAWIKFTALLDAVLLKTKAR